jgi:dTDP-4-dehydrorhamnose 3,5-epimerase
MNGENIIITGSNGQLGQALQQIFPKAAAVDRDELDITDQASLDNFDWSGIEIIINAAAYTNVDGAETTDGAQLAQKINVDGVQNLVNIAQAKDLQLVHISTDYVFDGKQSDHTETEELSPINVYGRTKAEADKIVLGWQKSYLVRTSWVIGDGKNFVRTMLGLGKKGISPSVVDDQFGRLTFTDELSRAIKHLLETKASYGIYNITNSGPVKSWAEITRQIFADAGFKQNVGFITTEEYFKGKDNIAPRPRNSDLNLDKIHASGFTSNDWQLELKKYIENELKEDK